MTIRLLMTADAVGGVWTYATDLAAGLVAHGVETTLALLGPAPSEDQLRQAAAIPGLELIETRLPLDWLSDEQATRRAADVLARHAQRNDIDVAQLNSPTLAVSTEWTVPLIGVDHGCIATWWQGAWPGAPLPGDLAWHRDLVAEGLARCERVIAPSAAFARVVEETYALPRAVQAVWNGRIWPLHHQGTGLAPKVLSAGRLWDRVKDTETLDALAALLPVPLEAAGALRGPHGESVSPTHLRWLGELAVDDLSQRMAARPVFVSAARFEPFGLAVLEAAAHGCALVLADTPTFRELWHGAAVFAPVGDAAAFAEATTRLFEDGNARLMLGERARGRAARYGVPRMAAKMAAEYRAVLRKMPTARRVGAEAEIKAAA